MPTKAKTKKIPITKEMIEKDSVAVLDTVLEIYSRNHHGDLSKLVKSRGWYNTVIEVLNTIQPFTVEDTETGIKVSIGIENFAADRFTRAAVLQYSVAVDTNDGKNVPCSSYTTCYDSMEIYGHDKFELTPISAIEDVIRKLRNTAANNYLETYEKITGRDAESEFYGY